MPSVKLFTFTGPVQSLIRLIFGFKTSRDYWFPDIRSLGGAVLVLSSVLYPYIYLACRSMFLMQGRAAADVARTLGAGPLKVFFRIQIPMARPAIMIGLTLVAMETLNDIGAVEFLGVQTLTFSIFDTWLNRGSLAGAAQIACIMLVFVIGLMMIERAARRRQRFSSQKTTSAVHDAVRLSLTGWKKWAAMFACLLPVLSGFAVPFFILGNFALKRIDQFVEPRLLNALFHSILVSGATAMATVLLGFVLAYAARTGHSRVSDTAGRLASFGYGVPGTVLAIGVLFPLAALDNAIDAGMRETFGISTGLMMTGTGFAIIYACSVRFLTMAEGTLEAGFQKLSPHLDMAARARAHGRTDPAHRVAADDAPSCSDCGPARLHRNDEGAIRHDHAAPLQLQHARHPRLRGCLAGEGGGCFGRRHDHRHRRHDPGHCRVAVSRRPILIGIGKPALRVSDGSNGLKKVAGRPPR